MTLEECLEAIGSNTKTYKLVMDGNYAETLVYIAKHGLADPESYPYSSTVSRLYAYQELVHILSVKE